MTLKAPWIRRTQWLHIAGATLLCTLATATAATNVVYVKLDAPGHNDGTSWHDAFNDLQDALSWAREPSHEIDEIWVAKGTHYPSAEDDDRNVTFHLVPDIALYGGFLGVETNLDQRRWLLRRTILSCDLAKNDPLITDPAQLPDNTLRQENCYHVVVGEGGASTIIDGFTITAGQAHYPDDPFDARASAGGMYNDIDSSPTVRNCLFTFNTGFYEGGALLTAGPMIVTDNRFAYNYVTFDGGAVFVGSHAFNLPGATLIGNVFLRNGSGLEGGAMVIGNASGTILDRSSFIENNAAEVAATEDGPGAHGGAITIGGSDVIIRNSIFRRNTSTRSGGAINISFTADVTVEGSTFVSNEVITDDGDGVGGAIAITAVDDSTVSVRNAILWGNDAPDLGTALYNGAVLTGATLTLTYSDLQDKQDANTAVGVTSIEPVLSVVPLFVDAAGGDLHLSADSPLIDEGAPGEYGEQTDIDDEPRVILGQCASVASVDIGSDERFYPVCWNGSSQCHGDANLDGNVNFADAGLWGAANDTSFGQEGYDPCADIDRNGSVDEADSAVIQQHMFTSPPSDCACTVAWPPP